MDVRKIAYWLSLVMIFTISWQNVVTIQTLGTISRVLGLLVATVWLLSVIQTNRLRKPRAFHVLFLLFVLWNAASTFWSGDVETTLERLFTFFQLFVFAYIIWDLYTTSATVRAGLQATVLGACVTLGSILINYESGVQESWRRFSAVGFNPNQVGLILALSLPLAWYLALIENHKKGEVWLNIINLVFIPSAIFAVFLTASRSAFLSTFPAVLYMIGSMAQMRILTRILICVVLVSSMILMRPFVPQTSLERLNIQSLDDRTEIWSDAVESIMEHPYLGVGPGAYRGDKTGKIAHNAALGVLAEVGIIGFGVFCAVMAAALYHLRFVEKEQRYLWVAVFLVWLVNSVAADYQYNKQFWLLLSLMIASAHVHAYSNDRTSRTTSRIHVT